MRNRWMNGCLRLALVSITCYAVGMLIYGIGQWQEVKQADQQIVSREIAIAVGPHFSIEEYKYLRDISVRPLPQLTATEHALTEKLLARDLLWNEIYAYEKVKRQARFKMIWSIDYGFMPFMLIMLGATVWWVARGFAARPATPANG